MSKGVGVNGGAVGPKKADGCRAKDLRGVAVVKGVPVLIFGKPKGKVLPGEGGVVGKAKKVKGLMAGRLLQPVRRARGKVAGEQGNLAAGGGKAAGLKHVAGLAPILVRLILPGKEVVGKGNVCVGHLLSPWGVSMAAKRWIRL